MSTEILQQFKDVVYNNGKIISERLKESYFININKHQLYLDWYNITAKLRTTYTKPSHLILAADVSLDIEMCEVCNTKPRVIAFDDSTNKRYLSKVCGNRCGPKSKQKVEKFKTTIKNKSDEEKQVQKDKREQTMLSRYGYGYNLQRPCVKEKSNKISIIDDEFLNLLTDKDWVHENYFIQKKSLSMIAYELSSKFNKNIWYGTIGDYVKKLGYEIHYDFRNSVEQQMVEDFLISLSIDYIKNDISILSPQHLDFYIPSANLAIEVNGVYWHTEQFDTHMHYHLNKTINCSNKEIKLLHFTDIEINDNFKVIKSIILSALGKSKKIYARKCVVKNVPHHESVKFLKENHLQKNIKEQFSYGLYFEDNLVSLMTFGESRYNKNYEWELYRFCSSCGLTVVGGASKLLSYFELHHKPKSIISYCNRMRSNGNLYEKLNFIKIQNSKPSFYWIKNGRKYSRYSCFKSGAKKILKELYDDTLSVSANFIKNKYSRFWDCGNFVFIKIYND